MEDRYKETHKTWNKAAKVYEEKFMNLEIYNNTYQRFCDLLSKPNASILEIGCGPGNITRYILTLMPNLQVLATDISENMVKLAKENNPTISTQILDCRNLKIPPNKFDGIICGFIIPYLSITDLSNLIKDCAASLTENGILYISYVDGDYNNSGFISDNSGDRTYFHYYDSLTIKEVLSSNNFDVISQKNIEYKKADGSFETHTIINAKIQTSEQRELNTLLASSSSNQEVVIFETKMLGFINKTFFNNRNYLMIITSIAAFAAIGLRLLINNPTGNILLTISMFLFVILLFYFGQFGTTIHTKEDEKDLVITKTSIKTDNQLFKIEDIVDFELTLQQHENADISTDQSVSQEYYSEGFDNFIKLKTKQGEVHEISFQLLNGKQKLQLKPLIFELIKRDAVGKVEGMLCLQLNNYEENKLFKEELEVYLANQ